MDRSEMENLLRTLVNSQELLEATMKPLAQLLFSKMTALVAAGFTREEAMEILKARGLNA